MATTTTKPDIEIANSLSAGNAPAWQGASASASGGHSAHGTAQKPSQRDAIQALLAFSALHDQLRRRKTLAARHAAFDSQASVAEFEPSEQFVLDEVLQLVAERAVAITGADGLAIALAENSEIVLRAAAGAIRPDVGARIDRDSAFSGACFRTAQIINCDDTELDPRVNLEACRKLGARSMVAVPLCGRRRVIGVLEAFSSWPFGFNDSDIRNLTLLAELVLGALKPEDEDRFAQSAQVAAAKLEPPKPAVTTPARLEAPKPPVATPAASALVNAVSPAVKTSLPPKPNAAAIPELPKPALTPPAAPAPVAPIAKAPEQPKAPFHAPVPALPPTAVPKVSAPPAVSKTAVDVPQPIVAKTPAAMGIVLSPSLQVPPKPAATAPADVAPKKVDAPAVSTATPAVQKPTTTATSTDKLAAASTPAPALEAPASKPVEPVLTFGQVPTEPSRPWMLIMLVGIVIGTAFAAGVWWKFKTAQIGNAIIHNEPVQSVTEKKPADAAATNPAPAPEAATDAESTHLDEEPATQQELATFPRVTGVRHWSSADSSTVVLDLEDQVQYEPGHIGNPDRVFFDLRDTQLATELQNKSLEGDTLLNHIRIAQPISGVTRIVLEARGNSTLSTPQVSLERDPYRLVIQVSKAGVAPKTAVNLFPKATQAEKNRLAIVVPPPTKADLRLRAQVPKLHIVVDAGHGGWDLGTVGRRGLVEKDLVLEISQRLGKLLQSRLGADVIYTRPDDNYVPLDERSVIANQAHADLFISVHANHSDLASARGVETYYTNFFSAPGSKDLSNPAGPKEAAMRSTPKNIPIPTLTPAELHDRIEQSRRLATSVQHSLYGTLSLQSPGLPDRGIKEAGFVVLTESAMPGILAEVSFVSSPTDEQKLRNDSYREQIAEALYRGIARYAASSKGVKVASAVR